MLEQAGAPKPKLAIASIELFEQQLGPVDNFLTIPEGRCMRGFQYVKSALEEANKLLVVAEESVSRGSEMSVQTFMQVIEQGRKQTLCEFLVALHGV